MTRETRGLQYDLCTLLMHDPLQEDQSPVDSGDLDCIKLLHKFEDDQVPEFSEVFQFTRCYWMWSVGTFSQGRFACAFPYEQE
mmetsp:Transcript_8020/g.49555  ORF Transcript_8020/g.49555 Transcript_8020/m.49555 type:complete len:83 (-) Transcript_8020:371-619(-)